MKIAVAGGTGVLGRHIVEACRRAGHTVSVLSRRTGSDLTSGEGLDAALGGVDVIIDASNTASQAKRQATTFFTAVMARQVLQLLAPPVEALQTASMAAGNQDVRLGGGPTMIRDFLAAGFVDHMHVVIVPILLGRGVRIWDGPESLENDYAVEAISSPSGVTHMTFSRTAAEPSRFWDPRAREGSYSAERAPHRRLERGRGGRGPEG